MNPATKQKIAFIVQQIKSNETSLVSVEVMTAFSPEGNTKLNTEISLTRANAFADILKPHLDGIIPTATFIRHSWKDIADKLREQNHISIANSIDYLIGKEYNQDIIYRKIRSFPEYYDIIKPLFTQMRYTTCRLRLVKLDIQNNAHNSN